jgi:hypothetical protein
MQQWEYMVWVFDEGFGAGKVSHVNGEKQPDGQPLPRALADAGLDGWELVSTHSTAVNWATYVLRRPKQ